jgi:hypothetical protein
LGGMSAVRGAIWRLAMFDASDDAARVGATDAGRSMGVVWHRRGGGGRLAAAAHEE